MDSQQAGIGLVQMEPVLGDTAENRRRSVNGIRQAMKRGGELIILPELCSSGYAFESADDLARAAEPIPGPATDAWTAMAREAGCYIVGGIAEEAGDKYFNTAVVVGPEGVVCRYRKLHLFDREKLLFSPGNLGLPVVDLPMGRIGLLICYDLRFVEVSRILAIQGVDLIAVPTNWVPTFGPSIGNRDGLWDAEGHCPQGKTMQMLAGLNQVFMAAADRVGTEGSCHFLGASLVADPWGNILLGPLSGSKEEVAVCTVDLQESQRARVRGPRIAPYEERRTDVYGDVLGYRLDPASVAPSMEAGMFRASSRTAARESTG
ncbi:MAG: hydratase [Chloroflexota bacterium]|nr:hydratase [Chloroflexota bacterium]